ncbi:hypothetical protein DMUE_0706 [Dictyocoela muelleri]|nr:hypothetical protein DMUE_0706 [Dictyocoela muelleri]
MGYIIRKCYQGVREKLDRQCWCTRKILVLPRTSIYFDKIQKTLEHHGIKQILTSPYNPTGNAISELRNAVILQVCRMLKGNPLSKLKEAICIRLNFMSSTVHDLSHYEIMFKKTLWNSKGDIENKLNKMNKMNKKIKMIENKNNLMRNEKGKAGLNKEI